MKGDMVTLTASQTGPVKAALSPQLAIDRLMRALPVWESIKARRNDRPQIIFPPYYVSLCTTLHSWQF